MPDLVFVTAGRLDLVTGAAIYERRVLDGLRALGWTVELVELPGRLPQADATATDAADALLGRLLPGTALCIDGEALPAFDSEQFRRFSVTSLLHHALALEPGLDAATAERLRASEVHALQRSRRVICPSAISAEVVRGYGVDAPRIIVVPPGLDLPPVPVRTQGARVEILAVGGVIPRKAHDLLVEALACVADGGWHLTIIGGLMRDAGAAAALHRAISNGGLEDRVTLAGEWPPETVGSAYRAADIFALASSYEGYGMVFAEAMAFGLPIVATTGGAIPEAVPASAGLLVPPGDRLALAAALRSLIGDASLRHRLAAAARAHAERLPNWPDTSRRFAAALAS